MDHRTIQLDYLIHDSNAPHELKCELEDLLETYLELHDEMTSIVLIVKELKSVQNAILARLTVKSEAELSARCGKPVEDMLRETAEMRRAAHVRLAELSVQWDKVCSSIAELSARSLIASAEATREFQENLPKSPRFVGTRLEELHRIARA